MEIGRIKDPKPKNSAEKSLPNAPAPYRDSLKKEVEKWKVKVRKLLIPDTPRRQKRTIITSELTDGCQKGAKRNSDANELPKRPERKSEAKSRRKIPPKNRRISDV